MGGWGKLKILYIRMNTIRYHICGGKSLHPLKCVSRGDHVSTALILCYRRLWLLSACACKSKFEGSNK